MSVEYVIADCLEWLPTLPDNSVDTIITDPPYNVLSLEWDKTELDWDILTAEFYRVLKPNGCLYVFGQMPMINSVFNKLNTKFRFKQDLVWYKNRGFSLCKTVFTKYHENVLFFIKPDDEVLKEFGKYIKEARLKLGLTLRAVGDLCNEPWYHRGGHMYFETGLSKPTHEQYIKLIDVLGLENTFECLFDTHVFNFEDIKLDGEPYKITRKAQKLYGVKSNLGEYTQINNGKRNPKTVLEYPVIQGGSEYSGHPTQKPMELIKYLIVSCTHENHLILDPFLGSGTTLRACLETGRNGIGCEKNIEYEPIIKERIRRANIPLTEFMKCDEVKT